MGWGPAILLLGAALLVPQARALEPGLDGPSSAAERAFDAPLAIQRLIEAHLPSGGDRPGSADAWDALARAKLLVRETNASVFGRAVGLSVLKTADPRIITNPTWVLYETPASFAVRWMLAHAALEASERAGLGAILADLRRARGYAVPLIRTGAFDEYLGRFGVEPQHGLLHDMIRPDLAYLRPLGLGRAARMHLAARREEWATFVVAAEDALALARVAGYEPLLIARLLGGVIDSEVTDALVLSLTERRPPMAVLVELAAAMDRQLADRRPLEYHLLAEHICVREVIEAGFGGAEQCSWREFVGRLDEAPTFTVQEGLVRVDREMMLRLHEQWTARALADCRTPALERGNMKARTELGLWASFPEPWLLVRLLPAMTNLYASDELVRVRMAGCRAMIGVEIFERRVGRLPESLQEVVEAGDLKVAPICAVTGRWLRYKRLDSPDGLGRRYIIYSEGIDGEDNGGRERSGDGFDWNERAKALSDWQQGGGFDYIVNSLRP